MTHRILIIEDETIFADNIRKYLSKSDFDCVNAYTGKDGLDKNSYFRPHLILLDIQLGDMSGIDILKTIRATNKKSKIIIMTAYGSINLAVEAMKLGADEFLTKPLELRKLQHLIQDLLGKIPTQREEKTSNDCFERILGQSPAIQDIKNQVTELLKTESQSQNHYAPPVLITGETGTGKELLAQAIHRGSARATEPFIEINCTTLPENLVESELFGHKRGAFTGATENKKGLFEAADGGTLFLDEIGDMPENTQLKLLKVLEDKEIRPIGSTQSFQVDVRVIAATNRSLEKLVEEGHFRADLYFRLSIIQFELPPLRERTGDALMLAEHFLRTQSEFYKREIPILTKSTQKALSQYDWPGNIRELRNCMEQLIFFNSGKTVEPHQLSISRIQRRHHKDEPIETGMNLEDTERQLLAKALEKTAWNVSAAAKILGITRDTLRYRIKRFNLKKEEDFA
ncbi:MAG: sigma-54 dependent transcriptional regulator [Gammaproteobacteria bacterium]|nr:sigma-54 dependent transcriptional regulator [Gammaproteobacteria bacterium]